MYETCHVTARVWRSFILDLGSAYCFALLDARQPQVEAGSHLKGRSMISFCASRWCLQKRCLEERSHVRASPSFPGFSFVLSFLCLFSVCVFLTDVCANVSQACISGCCICISLYLQFGTNSVSHAVCNGESLQVLARPVMRTWQCVLDPSAQISSWGGVLFFQFSFMVCIISAQLLTKARILGFEHMPNPKY